MKLDIWLGKVANLVKTSCMFLVLSVSGITCRYVWLFICNGFLPLVCNVNQVYPRTNRQIYCYVEQLYDSPDFAKK